MVLEHVAVGDPHTAAHNQERNAINALKFFVPTDSYYGGPDTLDALTVGSVSIHNWQTALNNCFEHAGEEGGIVLISIPMGWTDKLKHYGGMEVWQVSPRKIPYVPQLEVGLIALEDTAWYEYGSGSDGSGLANDNPGPIRNLCVDGRHIAGGDKGLFVMDANQSTTYDLMVTGSVGVGLNVGRSQNTTHYGSQIADNDIGVLLKPLNPGDQGPGHNYWISGHVHENAESIQISNWSAADFFFPHDNGFSKTIFETGRVEGQEIRVHVRALSGITSFDDVVFTYGAQVGDSEPAGPVEEDCIVLIDNPHYTSYTTVVMIDGKMSLMDGGPSTPTDGVRLLQSGAVPNTIRIGPDVGWSNVDNKICNDGSVNGYCDSLVAIGANSWNVAGNSKTIRAINGGTKLNTYQKFSHGTVFEKPEGLVSGESQGPFSIKDILKPYFTHSVDWEGNYRWINPDTGAVKASVIVGPNGAAFNGNNVYQLAEYTTATLPAASTLPRRMLWDSTIQKPVWSDGTSWITLGGGGGGTDDQTAAEVPFNDTGLVAISGSNVQAALAAADAAIAASGGTDDQTAAEVLFTDTGLLVIEGATVQEALAAADAAIAASGGAAAYGEELAYDEITANFTTANTVTGGAGGLITGLSITVTGTGRPVDIEFQALVKHDTTAHSPVTAALIQDGVSTGFLAGASSGATATAETLYFKRRLAPWAVGVARNFQISLSGAAGGVTVLATAGTTPCYLMATGR